MASTLIGAIGVIVGVYLPWVNVDPAREVIRLVYLPGMSSGLEVDVTAVLLLLIAVSVAASVLLGRSRFTGTVLLLAGMGSIVLPAYLLLDIYVVYGGEFIPHIGSLLTIFGGTVLLITGITVLVDKL
ncbi:hypothetical protein OB919_15325 [Halobacteria archaeon AArc-curdl1]|uniref:Uncharacterized protein n=1 Tax=Natronosalvus hydrolyticus TaxID=2979988 RepID=A0AAP2ZAC6_9EURY|nr:hypothetical protein [Halobacteria archaeon AArc-curdl1]